MPIYNYVASDAQGVQHKGKMPALDKNDLSLTLKKDGLFLISHHETGEVLEGLNAYVDQVQKDQSPGAATPATPPKEKFQWPIEGPSQAVWIVLLFVGCVFLGYLMGQ